MRRSMLPLLFLAGCDGCGEPCEPIPDPGNCWTEIGDLDMVTTLGFNEALLVAGDTAGGVHCYDQTAWTSSSVGSGRVDFVSQKRQATDFTDVLVAADLGSADAGLFQGDCTQGWTERTSVQLSFGGTRNLTGELVGAANDREAFVLVLKDGTLLLSTDGTQTFRELPPPWSGLPSPLAPGDFQLTVNRTGEVVFYDWPDLWTWDGFGWVTMTNPGVFEDPAYSPRDAHLMFASDGEEVVRSDDDGATWSTPTFLPYSGHGAVVGVAAEPDVIGPKFFVGREEGHVIYANDDLGSWTEYMECWPTSGLPAGVSVGDLDLSPSSTLVYLATSAGVFRENGHYASPCYYDREECFPTGMFGCRVGRPDPLLEETAWPDGSIQRVACEVGADGTCVGALDGPVHRGSVRGEAVLTWIGGEERAEFTGEASWIATDCKGGVCPLVVTGLSLKADAVRGGWPVEYVVEGGQASLSQPAHGGFRPATGEVLLDGAVFSGVVAATSARWGELSAAQESTELTLEDPVVGAVSGEGLRLGSSRVIDGFEVTVSLTATEGR